MSSERANERAFLLQDLSAAVLSLAVASFARDVVARWIPALKPAVPPSEYIHLLLVFLPVWALGADRVGLTRLRTLTGPMLDLARVLLWAQGWGVLAIAVILVGAQVELNRSLLALFVFCCTGLLAAVVLGQRRWLLRHHGRSLALMVGTPPDIAVEEFEGLLDRSVERLDGADPDALRARLVAGGVDEVVLGGVLTVDATEALLKLCTEAGVPAFVPVQRFDLALVEPRAEVVGRTLYLCFRTQDPDRPGLLLKAIFDRLAGVVALVIAAPLMAAIAAAIKVTTRGPVLFVQERGGINGRPFRMVKFRTMRPDAEAQRSALIAANEMDGPVFKISDDPRVTPIGRWLRRSSLDELPQLINVVLGQMSLVGPRPLPLIETRGLSGLHRRRLSVRPGITGLWQVSGRNELGFQTWMALDLHYVDNWSFGLDLAILLRTVPALVSRRGAR